MRVLGVVQWTNRDKLGQPIAGVRPLFEVEGAQWRPITPTEEFPTNGQVFWPNAQSAVEGALVIFRAEPNPGQKDEFRVVDPRSAHEVLDFRRMGTAPNVRAALSEGIRLPAHTGAVRAAIWCEPDLLVGPVDLVPHVPGRWRLHGTNLHSLPTCMGADVRTVLVDRHERLVRVDEAAASGFVDWDDDANVLRRAIELTGKAAKNAGQNVGLTKRQIIEAAGALAELGLGPKQKLELYRLERAEALLTDAEEVTRRAGDLAHSLQAHPAVKAALEELRSQARAEAEHSARTEMGALLAKEHAALQTMTESNAAASARLETQRQEIGQAEQQLAGLREDLAKTTSDAEAAIAARALAAFNSPLELLAEVSVLRPFLGAIGNGAGIALPKTPAKRPIWSSAQGEAIRDRASLRRMLTGAARAKGVDPSQMLRIHAAVSAGMMPVTVGSGGLAALSAYAQAACGNRLLVVHVSPGSIAPRDLYEMPDGGISMGVESAQEVDGVSLVVLEGANRSPLESSVMPILQLAELGTSVISAVPGLRLAATQVLGATTVPVTPQLWHHAVAIHPQPNAAPAATLEHLGDLPLSSELFVAGEPPTEIVESLLEVWPECRELRPALIRFGAAMRRVHDDEQRLTQELLHALVLPYTATALSEEEQIEALNAADDDDGALARELRRLRHWLR